MRGGIQGGSGGSFRLIDVRARSAIVPVSMTIQNEGSFLRVIYRGEEDLESEQATAAALIEAIQNHDCHKVLHDYRAVTGARMGTLDS